MVRQGAIINILYLILILSSFTYALPGDAPGNWNSTVNVSVNVTNGYPEIDKITINSTINLVPGTITLINCIVEAHDYNGGPDIVYANATFWDNNSVLMNDTDHNLTHYTNTNCTAGTPNGYNRNFTCGFNVTYYANASNNWICNATVKDNYTLQNFTDWEYNVTDIKPLYAINVTSQLDFGDQILGDTAENKTVNITNFGNQAMNISVDGYGAVDGDNLSMSCGLQGNLSLDDLRYSSDPGLTWATRTPLQDTQVNITGFTIPKINLAGVNPGDWFNTYWSLYINPVNDPFGECNGTIVFTAWNS